MSTKSVFHLGEFVTCNDLPKFNSVISTEVSIYQVAKLGSNFVKIKQMCCFVVC